MTKKTVRGAFHQPTGRDYVKKMTIEIDRELHAELKVIFCYALLHLSTLFELG